MGAATKGRTHKDADIIPLDLLLRVGITPQVLKEVELGLRAYNYGRNFVKNPSLRVSSFTSAVEHLTTALESIKPNTAQYEAVSRIKNVIQDLIDDQTSPRLAEVRQLRRGVPEGA